jgi:hypothetical protein
MASEDLGAGLSTRFVRSIAKAESAIAQGRTGVWRSKDGASISEYQEIILLKVKLQLETARLMSSAARLSAELVRAAEGLEPAPGGAGR